MKGIQNAHLYRLLRPEFVKSYHELCSDAFSGFIAKHDYREHNNEILEATDLLINDLIPVLADELQNQLIEGLHRPSIPFHFITFIH